MKVSLLILLLCTSCSSLNRSMITGALVGGVVASIGGAVFSPNPESIDKNAYLFGVVGAGAGAAAGYLLFEDPKKPKPPMMLDEPMQTHQEVPLFDFSPELGKVKPEVSFKPVKRYEVPQEKLPKELEGKVKKQYIIEYEAEARTIEIDNRTIQISPFKAWEHAYEN
jgi:hypothetical protein